MKFYWQNANEIRTEYLVIPLVVIILMIVVVSILYVYFYSKTETRNIAHLLNVKTYVTTASIKTSESIELSERYDENHIQQPPAFTKESIFSFIICIVLYWIGCSVILILFSYLKWYKVEKESLLFNNLTVGITAFLASALSLVIEPCLITYVLFAKSYKQVIIPNKHSRISFVLLLIVVSLCIIVIGLYYIIYPLYG
eukprot:448893_1